MEKLIVNFFKEHNLILHKKRLVVAVSTGVDSMALLVSLLNLRDEYNLDIHIVHVNHMVREQSNLEEEYILSFGKKNKLSVHAMHLEHNENINFQSYARTKRYGFFFNVMKEVKADYLLLAHHGIDNMETIIMRILRGSSLKGYAGIMPVQEVEGFKILRPFLNILKDELIDYINLHKIKYYEDYTNNEEIYTRNRIRKDLIPVMFQEEKNAHLKFNEFSNVLLEASNVIEEKVNGIIGTFIRGEKSISFTINEFKKHSDYIKEEILFTILKDYELSKANILEIIKLIDSKKKNIKVEFKDSFTFVKEYDKIIILYYLTKPLVVDLEIDGTKSKIINDTI